MHARGKTMTIPSPRVCVGAARRLGFGLEGELVLRNLATERYFGLDRMGARVYGKHLTASGSIQVGSQARWMSKPSTGQSSRRT